ncbi:MAG: transketolase [Candidatus Omnitrophica bacterium]|nr:transketolase [Candidatus Omnitrophota bacterium]
MNTGKYKILATKIRTNALKMTHGGKSGHVGSMLSMADLLAVLYEKILRVDSNNPKWDERDRFILSKGHGGGAVYAVLAEKGFFPKEWLNTYYKDNGKLSGHISHYVPGVEFSTGSLGHGLPVAVGMAISGRHRGAKWRVFCLMSDGDCDEGSTWEAIMFAAQHKLDNLIAIVDYNRVQALGHMEDVIELEPFSKKMEAFGWAVKEIDGHNYEEIEKTLSKLPFEKGKPSFVIARTVKGKGVSWMEHTVSCHYGSVNDDQLCKALLELEAI